MSAYNKFISKEIFNEVKRFVEFKAKTLKKAAEGEITTSKANHLIQPALTKAIEDSGIERSEFILMVLKYNK